MLARRWVAVFTIKIYVFIYLQRLHRPATLVIASCWLSFSEFRNAAGEAIAARSIRKVAVKLSKIFAWFRKFGSGVHLGMSVNLQFSLKRQSFALVTSCVIY